MITSPCNDILLQLLLQINYSNINASRCGKSGKKMGTQSSLFVHHRQFSSKSGWEIFCPVYAIIVLSRFQIIVVMMCLDYLIAHLLFFQWLWLWIYLEAGFDFYIWSLLMENNLLTVQSIFTTINWSSFIYFNHLPWELFVELAKTVIRHIILVSIRALRI